jgi:hypothetical protein
MSSAVGPNAELWLLETALVLTGSGLAFNTGPAVGLAMSAVPVARSGLSSGVVNLARLVGITVGIAVMGNVLALVGDDGRCDPQRHRHEALNSPCREVDCELTGSGRAVLVDVGIELRSSRRPVVRYGIDWTD